ncbi:MAG: hypothetical protein Q7V57_15650 [Actinomycetota bacterium]|nr:hypothetical protein [Actinomycetota bacterium]
MSDQFWPESWRLGTRARGVGLLLRLLVVLAPAAALGCTRLAADSILAIEVVVIAAAALVAIAPDSHVGLVVVALVGANWWASVGDLATPWSIGVAASLAVFHASAAAASVVPPSAVWTRAMCRRWLQRCSVVVCGSAATWGVVAAVHDQRVAGAQLLVAAALVVAASGALWMRGAS